MPYNNRMKHFSHLLFALVITVFALPAAAQDNQATEPPPPVTGGTAERCFTVYNTAPYRVHGSFYSDYFMTQYGTKGRNQSNFRLASGQRMEHCSEGPFIGPESDLLYFVLRTLIPVFSCHIRAEGEIVISGRRKREGGTDTWASCADK